jgi:hypothetical protein
VEVGTSLTPAALNTANGLAVSSGTWMGADEAALLTNANGRSIAIAKAARTFIVDPSLSRAMPPIRAGGLCSDLRYRGRSERRL